MTDKEFKRLSRAQLIDIIYQFQLRQDELLEENEKLSKALEDKRIRLSESGNIAEAALEIHKVMEAAQNAANHYIEEMQLRVDDECQRIIGQQQAKLKEAQEAAAMIIRHANNEAGEIVAQARQEAAEILSGARKEAGDTADSRPRAEKFSFDAVEAILREYRGEE